MTDTMLTQSTGRGEALRPVHCPHCASLGRTITAYTVDEFGCLFFIGKTLLALEVDKAKHELRVPCRVCGHIAVVPI